MKSSKIQGKFYYAGFLCLIPLVGLFAGIWLVYLGIFRYKSILLAITGFACIIINVALYPGFIYQSKRDKFTEDAFKIMAADKLDEIVNKLDFYKLEFGNYPDSLDELKKMDNSISITDPIFDKDAVGHAYPKFYYRKEKDKYVLFSVGKDGKPNTSDDVYPRTPLK